MLLVRHRQTLHRILWLQRRSGEFQAPPGRPQGVASVRQGGAQVVDVCMQHIGGK